MPVFGKETTGTLQVPIAVDHKWAVKYSLIEAGLVSKISAYSLHNGDPGTITARWSFYADDGGGGDPGTLLGTTQEQEITNGSPAWNDWTFLVPVQLSAGSYWFSYNSTRTGSRFGVVQYDNVAAASRDNIDTYAGGDSDPFGVGTPDVYEWAVYATYTVAQVDVLSMQAHVFGHGVW